MFRGGGWDDNPRYARVSGRFYDFPDYGDDYLGFRLFRTIP